MVEPESPDEHLRRALLDLEAAHRQFVRSYGHPAQAEAAARDADQARAQAAHWAAIAREATAFADDE